MVRTPPSGCGGVRKSRHRRIADILAEDEDSSDESVFHGYGYGGRRGGGGGMLPVFLNDQSDLVEVMLELDEESMVVRSVTPTSAAAAAAAAAAGRESSASLSRSSSTASRIRRKFSWLLSPTPRRTLAEMLAAEESASASGSGPLPGPATATAMSSRDARRIRARLERTRSGAQRALKGLRFISRTTTATANSAELWGRVEDRFAVLAKDGLLSREDFGECIGPSLSLSHTLFSSLLFESGSNNPQVDDR
ncbi:hypothetical protein C4D60_Mb08t24040 [Musa balbisiana]|uniref:NADPH oxidase Respiratory burst domain-containing protein n=1 Tax=Musa balbisiana TaxID=52838 RepID=A0A4S8K666_MUSBA|nr:hypothetical protein C4D60_Mb08t24040 [Musa balbisiana]